jgi:hypothetical protein
MAGIPVVNRNLVNHRVIAFSGMSEYCPALSFVYRVKNRSSAGA